MNVASRYWTYAELRAQVEAERDLEGESFISQTELLGYANQAIDSAEKIVKNTYADYFLDRAPLTLVAGVNSVLLPARIYAHKIRRIVYQRGSDRYTIERVKDWRKFEIYADQMAADTGGSSCLAYFLLNTTPGAPEILFTRNLTTSDASATVTCWFVRQANRLVSDADLLDIPEAANYVMAFMRYKCDQKEGNPGVALSIAQLNEEESSLQADLADMIPDADDVIEMDLSHYEDMT